MSVWFTVETHRRILIPPLRSDFEYSFGKSSEDAGFALPSVISLATNLHTLSIQSERSGAVSSYRRRTREVHSLDTFTGDSPLLSRRVSS